MSLIPHIDSGLPPKLTYNQVVASVGQLIAENINSIRVGRLLLLPKEIHDAIDGFSQEEHGKFMTELKQGGYRFERIMQYNRQDYCIGKR